MFIASHRNGHVEVDALALNENTQRKGRPVVGSKVEVRYWSDGKSNVATTVSEPAEAPARAVKTMKR